MSFYAMAEAELDDPMRRRENLWSYCKAHCDMDIDRAEAMYIREAAVIIENEYREEFEWQEIQRERIKEEERVDKENRLKTKRRVKEDIRRANSLSPNLNKWYFGLAGAILSLVTFSLGLILNADGFFSYLWRVPVAIVHVFSLSSFMYTSLVIFRYHFISGEKSKYAYIKDDGDVIYRLPDIDILLFFVSFIFLVVFYFFS
ncbi:hypothetical protein FJM67_08130 [Maribrevibacterium harenarium]|uniref:Uncharacterized protein n=1 Tax=Maribrevibacterium harenarium TaxID=2589817 RepID=A0A501WRF4_9GAMM|nr:hypothetical protein [Maribrevibacterium harenarium]TPE51938.1 hypothetical protein FJM67_08130 [Maribrevibacterium harenarium]